MTVSEEIPHSLFSPPFPAEENPHDLRPGFKFYLPFPLHHLGPPAAAPRFGTSKAPVSISNVICLPPPRVSSPSLSFGPLERIPFSRSPLLWKFLRHDAATPCFPLEPAFPN